MSVRGFEKRSAARRRASGAEKRPVLGPTIAIAAATALAMGAGESHSSAQASVAADERLNAIQTYQIPAGPMARALNAFADSNGLQLLYDAHVTQALNTPGLRGDYSVKTGLDRLLAGTGLSYRFSSGRKTVSILLAQADGASRSDADGAHVLPLIDVGAALRPHDSRRGASAPEEISAPAGVSTTVDDLDSKRATTSDAASLLRDTPGASVSSAGGVSGLPVLDGLADDRLHVTVAGMPLLAACANHMNPPLSYIDPSHVGAMRVYASIVPVSVGGDSIGGAILVSSPAPVFATPGQRILTTGQIGSFYRGNGNAYGANLSATAATENISLSYSGSYARSGNYTAGGNFMPGGPAFIWTSNTLPFTRFGAPTPWLNGNEVGSTAYETQNHSVSAALRHENHLLQFDLNFQHIPYQNYPNQRMDMTENRSIFGNLRYTGQFGWGALEAQAYHQSVRHIMDFNEDKQYYYGSLKTILAPGMPMDTAAQNTGGKLSADINLSDRHMLRVGGEIQRYHYDEWWPPSPAILPPRFTVGGMAPWSFQNINDGQRDRFDVFAELESRWSSEWLTQLGVRSDTVTMNTGPVHGYNAAYDYGSLYAATKFNNADRARTDQNWNITAQATYTPSAAQSYTFGYSQKSRSPNLYERYSWSPAIMPMEMIGWFGDGNFYVGNLALQPEVAHTISATAELRDPAKDIGLQITPYFTYVSNYIDVRRCPPWVCGTSAMNNLAGLTGFVSLQFVNQNARIFGVDASAHALLARDTPLGDFTAKGILSYVNGQNVVTGEALYQMMPINGKLSLEQRLGDWTSSVEEQLVGAKDHVEQVRNEVKTGAYALTNLRASYEWKNLRLEVGVENVFNTFYYSPLGGAYVGYAATMSGPLPVGPAWGIPVPGMGRSFYVATNVKF